MYTILGAGGAIGNEFSKTLFQNNIAHTLVSRNPKSINAGAHKICRSYKSS